MNVLSHIGEFIGRFHPLLVHLPIGILLLAALFQLLARKEKYNSLQQAARIALFLGMCSAIASCISGYLLSQTDDYNEDLLFKHQWLGIITAAVAVVAWYLHQKGKRYTNEVMMAMTLLLVLTAHLGGSITHGADYLTKAFSTGNEGVGVIKPLPDVQKAIVYADVIRPILETRCYRCHGPSRQKGKLRLDQPDFIMAGGKDGKILVPGKADESELIKRIVLQEDNEDHMPPKEKPQLSKQQIELLHWWISNGADFKKKVNEEDQPSNIKPMLAALQEGAKKVGTPSPDVPPDPVEKGPEQAIGKLKDRAINILPVSQSSNYLTANFVSVDSITLQDIQLLEPLSRQLIGLNLEGAHLSDSAMNVIGRLTALRRLSLQNSTITDKGMSQIKNLSHLQYLNLARTNVNAKGLLAVQELKKLRELYLDQTPVSAGDFITLRKIFPKTILDTGGYKVPFLVSDTTVARAP